ncbi:MAG: 50S ribosomal protein L33 [Gemmatimonadota bacterium]|nr:50S ribosomal protein L33 [Candidatus Palauibacter scopulicola]MDE2663324.1 50S ribosomal protein L33 [Candidatus Palauibacter scopulicola]MYA32073.1 50S ribosomal protein L33 [Gemmatimonadales bacterium]MYG49799.1 50S ribosomal protein L33 [Gemmatimonadales bacterium]MYK02091.1 50S ribosomal protein L33 [Candidatus Palauibacter ramosifaciens]
MRVRITLECTECKERNYSTTKNRRTHPQRAEQKKYCRRCNGHRMHKETR